MAGSYSHCVDEDGRLLKHEDLVSMLEDGGDVYEAVEQMYGMIWHLASDLAVNEDWTSAELVEDARKHYREGLELSPGFD